MCFLFVIHIYLDLPPLIYLPPALQVSSLKTSSNVHISVKSQWFLHKYGWETNLTSLHLNLKQVAWRIRQCPHVSTQLWCSNPEVVCSLHNNIKCRKCIYFGESWSFVFCLAANYFTKCKSRVWVAKKRDAETKTQFSQNVWSQETNKQRGWKKIFRD